MTNGWNKLINVDVVVYFYQNGKEFTITKPIWWRNVRPSEDSLDQREEDWFVCSNGSCVCVPTGWVAREYCISDETFEGFDFESNPGWTVLRKNGEME